MPSERQHASAVCPMHSQGARPPQQRTTGSVRGYWRCASCALHCRRAPASTERLGAPQRPQNRCAWGAAGVEGGRVGT